MSSTRLLTALVALVLILWFGAFAAITTLLPSWTERGQFGDLFGSINALFSGLAFAGLFYTIHLQRQELALQREELRLQREEMKGSREQLATQARAQQALFLATVAQVKVAAIQAEIEAILMEGENSSPTVRYMYWKQIRGASEQIALLATELEATNAG